MRHCVLLFLLPLIAGCTTPSPDETATDLAAATSRWATCEGHRIHYKSLGKGEHAVVLIHGWSCDMSFLRHQAAALAPATLVIAVDLLGHGQSDKPEVEYSVERFARGVDAVLSDAGVRRAVLVGFSMGTPVARQFWRMHPEKCVALIALDGSFRAFAMPPAQRQGFLDQFAGPGYRETLNRMMTGMLGANMDPALRDEITTKALATPQHVMLGAMKGMLDEKIWADDQITIPVLAIHARHPQWNEQYVAYVKQLCPDLEYHVIDGVGHFLILEQPASVNALLLAFLNRRELLS